MNTLINIWCKKIKVVKKKKMSGFLTLAKKTCNVLNTESDFREVYHFEYFLYSFACVFL